MKNVFRNYLKKKWSDLINLIRYFKFWNKNNSGIKRTNMEMFQDIRHLPDGLVWLSGHVETVGISLFVQKLDNIFMKHISYIRGPQHTEHELKKTNKIKIFLGLLFTLSCLYSMLYKKQQKKRKPCKDTLTINHPAPAFLSFVLKSSYW